MRLTSMGTLCKLELCDTPVRHNGYCGKHYTRVYKYGDPYFTKHDRETPKNKRAYDSWSHMKNRCKNPNDKNYYRYGGRGITYAAKWEKFKGFWEDMGGTYADNLTLDRIDNNKGYYKDNCRWATWIDQQNNRRSNRYFVIDGISKTFAEWIKSTGVKQSTAHQRYYVYKWPIEEALGLVSRTKVRV